MTGALIDISTRERIGLLETTIIGRKKECHICLEDGRVSRQHAMIRGQHDGDWFYDLGSANGSYINDQRVTTTRRLIHNDVIQICEFRFRYDSVSGIGGTPRTASDATVAEIRTIPVILFVSDVRGFTRISEKLPPDALAETIGSWYRECDRVIGFYGGSVDKFIGDAVLAYWPSDNVESRLDALRAANALLGCCIRITDEMSEVLEPFDLEFTTGVGLHVGQVAQGNVGEGTFTILGDAVNVAFRVESLTRKVDKDVLVTEAFVEGWEDAKTFCRLEGSYEIKGHSPISAYSIQLFPPA